jgi:hypothetical protein
MVEEKVKNPKIVAMVNFETNFGILYYPSENKLY